MLQLDDVAFRYPRGPWVLEQVSLAVEPGEVVGLAGPSGRGKSTLGRLACGILRPARGSVRADGRGVRDVGRGTARPVQLVAQDPLRAMNPRWHVGRVLAEADPAGPALDAPVVAALVRRTWLDRYPHEISGGELQRVSLARALLARPRYLVADEISASLDPIAQARLWHDLLDVVAQRAVGVLAISHDAPLLEAVADRVEELPEELPEELHRGR